MTYVMSPAAAWYDFLEDVREARKKLGGPVWYRGHASVAYQLVPSLVRYDAVVHEREMFHEFRKYAGRLVGQRTSEWETLFDMQHYGVPTRLLDWTETFSVAVAFAVLDRKVSAGQQGEGDAAVFLLNPQKLNAASGRGALLELPSTEFSYTGICLEKKPYAMTYPMAVTAGVTTITNERMFAQRGVFTLHGERIEGLEDQVPAAVAKIPLRPSAIDGAKEFLENAGVNSVSLFPDLIGLARHVRLRYVCSAQ